MPLVIQTSERWEPGHAEGLVEKLPGLADKGPGDLLLISAQGFAHEHDRGPLVPLAWDVDRPTLVHDSGDPHGTHRERYRLSEMGASPRTTS